MMKIRLYVDEDSMSRALVRALRARGCDVETALDVGMIERSDEEHLEHASARSRVLFTCNVGDFCRLHAECLEAGRSHAGIVVEPHQLRPVGSRLRALLALISELDAEQMEDRLEFLSFWIS